MSLLYQNFNAEFIFYRTIWKSLVDSQKCYVYHVADNHLSDRSVALYSVFPNVKCLW